MTLTIIRWVLVGFGVFLILVGLGSALGTFLKRLFSDVDV